MASESTVLISTNERPLLLKGHMSDAKGIAPQEGFHCIHICNVRIYTYEIHVYKHYISMIHTKYMERYKQTLYDQHMQTKYKQK